MNSSAMKHKKTAAIFSNECHLSRDEKIDIDDFDFLGVICRYSINIRIEVHFLFALGNGRTQVACKALLKDLHATRVLSFPDANKKVYFNP